MIPSGAKRLQTRASALGWRVEVTTSRGTWAKTPDVEIVAVRGMKHAHRFVATWHDGKRHVGYTWVVEIVPGRNGRLIRRQISESVSAADLNRYLEVETMREQ